MVGIHNYERMYEVCLRSVKECGLSERNKKFILEFVDDCVLDQLGKPRIIRLVYVLKKVGVAVGKDFDTVTKEDIKKIVMDVETDTRYSPWTKASYKAVVKKFYKWLRKMEDEYPPEVKWIKANIRARDKKMLSQEDLLTEEEMQAAIRACLHPRDRALLALLSESGARISEIGNLTLRKVSLDKRGCILSLEGKTGCRRIRVVWSSRYLVEWLNSHPAKEKDAPLWFNVGARRFLQQMTYAGMQKVIKNAFKRAKIKKRVYAHLFRHSRASIMANHMTEFQMNAYFGWIQGSKMAATYVHLSGKNLDDTIYKINGMEAEAKPQQAVTQPRICARCQTVNAPDGKYCATCGEIVDPKVAIEAQQSLLDEQKVTNVTNEVMNQLMLDQEVQAIMKRKITELGLRESLGQLQ